MSTYIAPIEHMLFIMQDVADIDEIAALTEGEDVSPDIVAAILEEAGKFGRNVLAPINGSGDQQGCHLQNGHVQTADGFKAAYHAFVDGGWNSVAVPQQIGGQGLPRLVATAVSEIWHASNMSFGLCPLLTASAIELLRKHGSSQLNGLFLAPLVSGHWTGTMNLTEPHAGSDLSTLRTTASKQDDHYLIRGQKIYISYGDHDLAENIVHMVLARAPDAPPGIKGLSLFVVPKFLVRPDGTLGARNDIRCVSLEKKLGIKASPTVVMQYGENDGAVGFLIGEENHGIEYMFTMMNHARLAVGLEGLGIAERAYQAAVTYAQERHQGHDPKGASLAIAHHPDVKRMLIGMRAQTEAARCLIYWVAAKLDIAERHADPATSQDALAVVDLMTPVVKALCTDIGVDVADTAVQVHGGMGYIEETGVAQNLRDARVAPIYEGTNGIQAIDLVGRKITRDNGETMDRLIAMMRTSVSQMSTAHPRLSAAIDTLDTTTRWICETYAENRATVLAGANIYLRLAGLTVSGWLMVRAMEAANVRSQSQPRLAARQLATTRYAARHLLASVPTLGDRVMGGGQFIADAPVEDL
jgi:alkylation response protein AidB-like acyl-CoA dehydrogenase